MSSYLLVSRPRSTCARWRRSTRTRPATSPPSAWPSGGRTSRTRTSHPTGQVSHNKKSDVRNIVTNVQDPGSLRRTMARPTLRAAPCCREDEGNTTWCPDCYKLLLELDWIWNISFCLFPVLLEWLSVYFIVPFPKETPPLYHHIMMSICKLYYHCLVPCLSSKPQL